MLNPLNYTGELGYRHSDTGNAGAAVRKVHIPVDIPLPSRRPDKLSSLKAGQNNEGAGVVGVTVSIGKIWENTPDIVMWQGDGQIAYGDLGKGCTILCRLQL